LETFQTTGRGGCGDRGQVAFSPSFEVNLINIQEFFNFQNKYIVNLLEQICAVE